MHGHTGAGNHGSFEDAVCQLRARGVEVQVWLSPL
ncbi:hypothetical protein MUK42_11688 [Musa troglodytarum]|uniref:Uncharacterized protein n=1 Tax=Musa troglodytarum TaxID=320322 RepID=A0A9E7GTK6_9LILI|nr:hypothetical protein MUK42_11688 [Musa troglodytarum]